MLIRSFLISLCVAGLAVAQTTATTPGATAARPRRGGAGRGPGPGPGGLFGPDAEARLTKRLGLDAGQQNTLHTALLSANVQNQGMKEKMTALRSQLATAMKAGDESGIDKATLDIATLNQQQSAIHAKTLAKVYGSLRDDQKAKFAPELNREAGVPGPRGPGQGPGGRGPRPGGQRRAPGTAAPAQQ